MLMVRPVVVARGYACAGVVPLACLRGLAECSWCAGGGGRVYLRRDGERMSEARPVLMVCRWWCGGYVGVVASVAGVVSTSGACAAVCLRRVPLPLRW